VAETEKLAVEFNVKFKLLGFDVMTVLTDNLSDAKLEVAVSPVVLVTTIEYEPVSERETFVKVKVSFVAPGIDTLFFFH
jgi:hypothetical protein